MVTMGEEGEFDPNTPRPSPSQTPISETWQDGAEPPSKPMDPDAPYRPESNRRSGPSGMITVMVCPVTGMRATANCPDKQARSYRPGTEPKEFCTFHR